MELGRFAVWLALLVVAVSQCSEARHSVHRREADDTNYDDTLADEASDDDTQNDTDIGADDEHEKIEIPAIIETQPTQYKVTIGKNIRLECKVSPENGTVVQWYKDNVLHFLGGNKLELNATRYSLISDSKDLLINDVQPEDNGVYRCEVAGKPVSINHTVVVMESPKIIRFTATNGGSIVEGSDLLLTCDVDGHPEPQIIWSRDAENGNRRLEEKDGEFSMNSVFFKNVKREHAGTYYCYALNSVGHNQAEVKVVVLSKPQVQVHKKVVNSALKVEAVLQCSVHDESTPHIRWYKDGRLIEDSSSQFTVATHGAHSNLTVIPSADGDFGTFTCEAENIHGKHNRSIDLVQSPVIEDMDFDGPKLSWTVHSHQPLEEIEVQLRDLSGEGEWRRLSVPLPENKDHKYDMVYTLEDKISEAGKYEAVVKVKNNHGWSGPSDPVFIDIEAQPQYIQHASVFRGNGASTIRPTTTAALSTILMYLLVRML